MVFDPGLPLPATEEETAEGILYHALTVDFRVVTLLRQAGRWSWHFPAAHHPDGQGAWVNVVRLIGASDGSGGGRRR